jgi:hypothetical protein
MIIFTLCVNFVSALGIFSSVPIGATKASILTEISGLSGGYETLWVVLLVAIGFTIVIAKWVSSTSIIGIYLFSSIFWTSYSRCITVININNFIPTEFLAIFTVGLAFIWVAAIIGMLTSVS